MKSHQLFSPASLKSPTVLPFVSRSRKRAIDILQGNDKRLLCIVGPCSIHDRDSAIEYGKRFRSLAQKLEDTFFLIMRVYCEKSRTQAGWKGFLTDPDLDGTNDIAKGVLLTRQLLVDLAEMEVPCATEFLDPLAANYFEDLITWGLIGARTCSSQIHRQLASSFDFPIGFKNNVFGEIDSAIYGILTARQSHVYLGIDENGFVATCQSDGNPFTHLVLRGSDQSPNYDALSVQKTLLALEKNRLEPRLLIDCSHGNSGKDNQQQMKVFRSILQQIREGQDKIFGLMLESHLVAGKQPLIAPQDLCYGCSITDSCMGWEETEELLLEAADSLPTLMSSVQK